MAKANYPAWILVIVGIILLIGGVIWYFASKTSSGKTKVGPIILGTIGLIFLIVGIVLFFKPKKQPLQIKQS